MKAGRGGRWTSWPRGFVDQLVPTSREPVGPPSLRPVGPVETVVQLAPAEGDGTWARGKKIWEVRNREENSVGLVGS